jgi:YD repeat-containing protein
MEVETPLGLVSGVKAIRTVELADSSNPFSLVSQTDTLRVNGRPFVNVFDATTRTFTATTPEGRTSSGLVDSLGRVIAEVVPGVDTVKYTYDTNGRLLQTTQGSRLWRYTYDARGRLDSEGPAGALRRGRELLRVRQQRPSHLCRPVRTLAGFW